MNGNNEKCYHCRTTVQQGSGVAANVGGSQVRFHRSCLEVHNRAADSRDRRRFNAMIRLWATS